MKYLISLCFLLLILVKPALLKAQSFAGYNASSYGGVYATLYNPANILDHRFRADINLVGLSVAAENNIVSLHFANKKKPAQFPKNIANNGYANFQTDVMGPSFMMRLSDKHAFAITTRARAQANVDRASGDFLNLSLQENIDTLNGRIIKVPAASVNTHAWNELEFTYSRQIGITDLGVWKAAVSIKYLSGQGAAYLKSNKISFTYLDSLEVDVTAQQKFGGASNAQGNINYAYASFMDDWDDYKFKFFQQPGLGVDLGVTYEFRDELQVYETQYNTETLNYKWKAGFSITDIGSIKYKASPNSANNSLHGTYLFNDLSVPDSVTTVQGIAQFYRDAFGGGSTPTTFTMQLPTTAHLMFDYAFNAWLSAQAHIAVPLIGASISDYTGTHTSPYVLVTPRAELPWCGIYLPISYQVLSGFHMGGALRIGPLVVGSGTGVTALATGKSKSLDAYFILRIPFFGYREYETENIPPARTKLQKLARKLFKCPGR